MKRYIVMLLILGSTSNGYAATRTSGGDASLLVWLFVGFIALFIVSQLIPSVVLTFNLIRGLFSRPTENNVVHRSNDHVM